MALAAGLLTATIGVGVVAGGLSAAPQGGEVDARRAQIRAIEAELISIDAEAQTAAGNVARADARLERAKRELASNTARLKQARKDLALSRQRLSERLVAIYREEPPTFVEVLLSADGLTGAVDAQAQLSRVGAQDKEVIESVRRSRARLASTRRRLAEERDTAEQQREAAAEQRAALEGLIGQRRAVLDQARAGLAQVLAAQERRRRVAALAAAQAQQEGQLRDVAAGSSPSPGSTPSSPTTAPASPDPSPTPSSGVSGDVANTLDRIAQCESGGNPRAISPDGQYRGKYQFHPGTWAALGGSGDPAAAPEAEQDRLAAILLRQQGSSPWPVCGA